MTAPRHGRISSRISSPLCRIGDRTRRSCALAAPKARAHPHVWAKSQIEILHSGDGVFKGVRHSWTFDEMFSTFATFGLAKQDGRISGDQLAALAERYVRSLKAYDYFTYARQDGRSLRFEEPLNQLSSMTGASLPFVSCCRRLQMPRSSGLSWRSTTPAISLTCCRPGSRRRRSIRRPRIAAYPPASDPRDATSTRAC